MRCLSPLLCTRFWSWVISFSSGGNISYSSLWFALPPFPLVSAWNSYAIVWNRPHVQCECTFRLQQSKCCRKCCMSHVLAHSMWHNELYMFTNLKTEVCGCWSSFTGYEVSAHFTDCLSSDQFLADCVLCSPGQCEHKMMPFSHQIVSEGLGVPAGEGGLRQHWWTATLTESCEAAAECDFLDHIHQREKQARAHTDVQPQQLEKDVHVIFCTCARH